MHTILAAASSGTGFYQSGDVLYIPLVIIVLLIASSLFGKNRGRNAQA